MPGWRKIVRAGRAWAWPAAARRGARLGAMLALAGAPVAHAYTAEINKLSDVNFSSINPLVSATSAQSLCVYSSEVGNYSITGTGSGSGGAFTLNAGAGLTLPYGVQWAATSGATSGTALTPSIPLNGQSSLAQVAGCVLGLANTASLIVTLAASDLQTASAGVTYTGVLTLVVAPQ